MRTFSVQTLGCKVNQYESEQLAALLRSRGLAPIAGGREADADLRIINTCSVTVQAAAKSRHLSRRAVLSLPQIPASPAEAMPESAVAIHAVRAGSPRSRVVVTGCWATSDRAAAEAINGVDAVIGHHQNVAAELIRLLDLWQGSSVRFSGLSIKSTQSTDHLAAPEPLGNDGWIYRAGSPAGKATSAITSLPDAKVNEKMGHDVEAHIETTFSADTGRPGVQADTGTPGVQADTGTPGVKADAGTRGRGDTATDSSLPGISASPRHRVSVSAPELGTIALPLLTSRQTGRQRAHLKVQDGCDAHCTYCIIPHLRPTLWSKPVADAVAEANQLVAAGHVELVLTGIFLGAYGQSTALRRRRIPADAGTRLLADAETRGHGDAGIIAGDAETRRRGDAGIIAGDADRRRRGDAGITAGDAETRRRGDAGIIAGDAETRRRGDAGMGKPADADAVAFATGFEAGSPRHRDSASPRQPVLESLRPRVSASPRQPVLESPRPRVSASPRQPKLDSPRPRVSASPRQPKLDSPRPRVSASPRQPELNSPRPRVSASPRQPELAFPRQLPPAPLAELASALCTGVPGLRRLRFSSLEPGDLDEQLVAALRSHRQVVPHFHLPLQSGSDALLRRMNRQYTRDDYLRMIDRVRGSFDRPALTTDIIVGFPGETDAEFERTLEVAEHCRFIHIHAFSYSPRPGTAAARWTSQFVPGKVVNQRIEALRARARLHSFEFRKQFIGKEVELLVELDKEDGAADPAKRLRHGRCERYFPVHFEAPAARPGDFLRVRIDRVEEERTFGTAHS